MQELIEDFIQYLRNERGQSENTQKTYLALLTRFAAAGFVAGLTPPQQPLGPMHELAQVLVDAFSGPR